jgi:hypothetical protein
MSFVYYCTGVLETQHSHQELTKVKRDYKT